MPKVEIYTTASCAYCVAAKMLLKQRGYDYEEFRVDTDPARYSEMLGRSNSRSVPQLFIDGSYVGGYAELAAADRDGRLAGAAGGAA
jgi:glutaredoxin 3